MESLVNIQQWRSESVMKQPEALTVMFRGTAANQDVSARFGNVRGLYWQDSGV